MKYIKLFSLGLVLSCFLTGCVSYKELHEIGIVNMIGIDYKNDSYHLTLSVLIPSKEDQTNKKILTETCNDLNNCFYSLTKKSTKKLYLEHNELLLVSRNLSKENYDHIFKFFLNKQGTRNTFNIISVSPYQKEWFEQDASTINELLEIHGEESSSVTPVTLEKVMMDVLNKQRSYLPFLELKEEIVISGYQEIYSGNRFFDHNLGLAYNFLQNTVTMGMVSSDICQYLINDSTTTVSASDGTIHIFIQSTIEVLDQNCSCYETQENYHERVKQLIYHFIESTSDDFFRYYLYQYDYFYTIKHPNEDISFEVEVNSYLNEDSTMKRCDIFE